jgi:origin recognition complex subunit 5
MESCVSAISEKYSCREEQVQQLYKFYGRPHETFPPALFVHGDASTGKMSILKAFFSNISIKFVIIDCIECYSPKILYEQIINDFRNHILTRQNNYANAVKDFLDELRQVDDDESYVVILKNAERARDMDHNILPIFMRLPELTGLNISTILVSHLSLDKYYQKSGLPEIQVMYFPDYSKKDIVNILKQDLHAVSMELRELVEHKYNNGDTELAILKTLDLEFYENFLNLFLNVFYKLCKDVKELDLIVGECYVKYCDPVIAGSLKKDDVTGLWRNITKVFQTYLSTLYIRLYDVAEV